LKKQLKDEIIKPKYKPMDINESLGKAMKDLGLEILIKNKINELYSDIISIDGGHPLAPALINGLDIKKPLPPLPGYFT